MHVQQNPLLLFCDPDDIPAEDIWHICEKGYVGNMEANIMAGRALFAVLRRPHANGASLTGALRTNIWGRCCAKRCLLKSEACISLAVQSIAG